MGDDGFQNNTQEFVVPEGNLFAMGDNRDNSLDSRFMDGRGVGFLPIENLVGRAEFIFFSIDASAPWWQIWEWPLEIRWSRLLTGIHVDRDRISSVTSSANPDLLREALTHRSAVPRHRSGRGAPSAPTSGWNSSGTVCWAC